MSKRNNKSPSNYAENVIQAASVKKFNQVYYVNAFASFDISITAQRRRALNLGWALCQNNIVKNKSIIAVVGAGFSGLAIAVELALLKRCVVILIEKEKPFRHFNQSAFRYIDKKFNISSSPGGNTGHEDDFFPLFQWEADNAHVVVQKWLSEFEKYQRLLPIFLWNDLSCDSIENTRDNEVLLKFSHFPPDLTLLEPRQLTVQTCIIATGFGLEERSKRNVYDYSYWKSGAPFHYHSYKAKEKILISGGGDSGLIEVLHYLFHDFSHSDIKEILKPFEHEYLDQLFSQTFYYRITKEYLSPKKRIEDDPLIKTPLLVWYWSIKLLVFPDFPITELKYPKEVNSIYLKIDRLVGRYIDNFCTYELVEYCSGHSDYEHVSDDILERCYAKLCRLSKKRIDNIVDAVKHDLDNLKNSEIFELFKQPAFRDNIESLKNKIINNKNNNYTIYWIVPKKDPLAGSISPVYIPIIVALVKSGAVKFIDKRILRVKRTNNQMRVTFKDLSVRKFDRVATRHGPSRDNIAKRFKPRYPEKIIESNEIVGTRAGYYEPRFTGKYINYSGYVYPVTDDLRKALKKVKKRKNAKQYHNQYIDLVIGISSKSLCWSETELTETADYVYKTRNWCWINYLKWFSGDN